MEERKGGSERRFGMRESRGGGDEEKEGVEERERGGIKGGGVWGFEGQ